MIGKGQWMITTRRRLWILSPGIILLKTAVVACAVFALAYSIRLGFKTWWSDAAVARLGTVTNIYMNKNSREAERREQILLFAYNLFTKRSELKANRQARALREPFPTMFQVEQQLGKADARDMDGEGWHLTWNQVIWQKPEKWPSPANQNETWPSVKNKIFEAWFDKRGFMTRLVMIRREPDGRIETECIGRLPSDWNLQIFDP